MSSYPIGTYNITALLPTTEGRFGITCKKCGWHKGPVVLSKEGLLRLLENHWQQRHVAILA